MTHQAISELRQSRSQMSEDNALSESQLLSIKVPDPPTTIDLNALSNEKSNVISVLENLPGNDLREKIDLLRRSHAELKDELNRLKQNLQMNREKGNTIRRKLEDKLHIKLDHSENTLKQLHQAETNTTFGCQNKFKPPIVVLIN